MPFDGVYREIEWLESDVSSVGGVGWWFLAETRPARQ